MSVAVDIQKFSNMLSKCCQYVVYLLPDCYPIIMHKTKEPVRLREKKLKSGGSSLYLDIYLHGQRRYEFLGLYLRKERTKQDREANSEVLRMADAVRARRQIEIQSELLNIAKPTADITLYNYIDQYTRTIVRMLANHIWKYEPNQRILLRHITPLWVRGFHAYLDRATLKPNSKVAYFNCLKRILKDAVRQGLLPNNPAQYVEGFSKESVKRNYLSIEEVRAIAATRTGNENVRRAFVFSCLTGLRFSDIKALTWGKVQEYDGNTRLVFQQQKTGGLEYLDIVAEAVELMGERGTDEQRVFHVTTIPSANYALEVMRKEAGITKHISFHTARHTHATMLLSLGVDIYVVSKLLGHRNITTTQIYAKIVDKTKQEAVNRIPRILSGQTSCPDQSATRTRSRHNDEPEE